MPKLFVLFNLRAGADPAAYERWAAERDVPAVRALSSVSSFTVHRVTGALGGEAPYEYVEVIDVEDMERFGREVAGEEMQRVAAEFREHADDPRFMVSEPLA